MSEFVVKTVKGGVFGIGLCVFGLSGSFVPSSAFGDAGYPTDAELPMLPPYCAARLRKLNSPEAERWKRYFGYKNWATMHHYCQHMNEVNRAYKAMDSRERKKYFSDAYKGFVHYLQEVTPDFRLMHEVYFNIATTAPRVGKPGEAITALQKAIQLNPKYTRAYGALSDIYREQGDREKALEVVEKGLKEVPKSKGLLRRKKELTQAS